MLSEEALVKAVKRALLSQSDDGMVKELLVIHEREIRKYEVCRNKGI